MIYFQSASTIIQQLLTGEKREEERSIKILLSQK